MYCCFSSGKVSVAIDEMIVNTTIYNIPYTVFIINIGILYLLTILVLNFEIVHSTTS